MSILATDLTNIDTDKFLLEVRRRIQAGELTAAHLGMGPGLEAIDTEVLSLEVHRRLTTGDMTESDFDADRLTEMVNACLKDGSIEPDDIQIGGDLGADDDDDPIADRFALDEAAIRFQRRDYRETLWSLEKALGYAFRGLGDLKPEHLE